MKPLADLSDRDLAQRVGARGDERAFRVLFRRHTASLYRFALRLAGGNAADAEDIVQEAWLGATQGIRRFRWESSLRTWLRAIALNVWRRRQRRRDPDWLSVEDGRIPAAPPPDFAERLDLERALALLPAGYRTVLMLHDGEGLTHAEIGSALGISAGTSKSQLAHARARMRSLLVTREKQP